jgi:hypothetical protein
MDSASTIVDTLKDTIASVADTLANAVVPVVETVEKVVEATSSASPQHFSSINFWLIAIIVIVLIALFFGVKLILAIKSGGTAPELDAETSREIMKKQQKILAYYQKSLSGKNLKALQTFASSGKQPGGSEFFALDKKVQEAVIKLNMSGLDVMIKNAKGPVKKIQFWLAKTMTQKLATEKKSRKNKKKKKK